MQICTQLLLYADENVQVSDPAKKAELATTMKDEQINAVNKKNYARQVQLIEFAIMNKTVFKLI